jgi:alkylation response protein AidB-like acyl-CoA dehydrogenase
VPSGMGWHRDFGQGGARQTAVFEPIADPLLVERIRACVTTYVEPTAAAIDRDNRYPRDEVRAIARGGFATLSLPAQYGGEGRPLGDTVAVFEEVSRASGAAGASLITSFLAQTTIVLYGTPTVKQRYLPRFGEGLVASFAMTEAAHGSDVRHLDTKARLDGDRWIIDGAKAFVTSASAAGMFVILAETADGVSSFVVPRDAPGVEVEVGQGAATFGLRNGPHVTVRLIAAMIPKDHLLGSEGKGIKQSAICLDHSRVLAGAICIGIARAAVEGALQFARTRKAFDKHVIDFQGIQWYFADLVTEIEAARQLVYAAARAVDAGRDLARLPAQAKLLASRVAVNAASQAIQICGAQGMLESLPFGRYLRDAKAYEIAGGSSEILKNTIAEHLD